MTKKLMTVVGGGIVASLVLAGCTSTPPSGTTDLGTATPVASSSPVGSPTSVNEQGVLVGGALMVKTNDIVSNAMNSKDHTTLVAAVKAAGLVDTLKAKGPFTVFAPTNDAFAKLPSGVVDALLLPANKKALTTLLTYHVVSGSYKASDLKDGMKLKTVQGEMLVVSVKNGKWMLKDAKGNSVNITIADVIDSNGTTFVVDGVLMPTAFKAPAANKPIATPVAK